MIPSIPADSPVGVLSSVRIETLFPDHGGMTCVPTSRPELAGAYPCAGGGTAAVALWTAPGPIPAASHRPAPQGEGPIPAQAGEPDLNA